MRRLSLALLLSLVVLVGSVVPALAGADWCPGDPILNIQGSIVTVEARIPRDRLADLKGPVTIRVKVPEDVRASVVAILPSEFQQEVKIVRSDREWEGRGPVQVSVEATAKNKRGKEIPIQLQASGEGVRGSPKSAEDRGEVEIKFLVAPRQR